MRAIDADACESYFWEHLDDNGMAAAMNAINDMPTIEPQRKKGKWIYGESEAGNDGYYCSKCGNFVPWKYDEYDIDFIKEFLFCNNCGADMRTPVEIARNIVHEAIDNSEWSDSVDTAKMHKVVDDKYAEMTRNKQCLNT